MVNERDQNTGGTMPSWLLDILMCPADASILAEDTGSLKCNSCSRAYPVAHGIPSFFIPTASGVSQQRVYDAIETQGQGKLRLIRNWADELAIGFQHTYKTSLLRQTLACLGKVPAEGETWIYTGGGEGVQCMILSAMAGKHVSFDVSMGQLLLGKKLIKNQMARRYYPDLKEDCLQWVHGNAEERMPFRNGISHVTYGIGVLNHINPEKWHTYLSDMVRITKPDGLVFHVVPNLECEIFRREYILRQYKDPASIQYFTQFVQEEKVCEAFERAGVRQIRTYKIWNFDNDSYPSILKGIDLIPVFLNKTLGLNLKSFSMRIEKILAREAERGSLFTRGLRLKKPRHLLVSGTV